MAAAAVALALGVSAATASAATKACWVYVGPIEDFGWTYQHHQGLEAVKAAYGDKVETAYVASVPEADCSATSAGRTSLAACRAAARAASSEVPGTRLNDSVTAGYWP